MKRVALSLVIVACHGLTQAQTAKEFARNDDWHYQGATKNGDFYVKGVLKTKDVYDFWTKIESKPLQCDDAKVRFGASPVDNLLCDCPVLK